LEPMCCQKDPIQSFFVVKGCQRIKAVTVVALYPSFRKENGHLYYPNDS